MSFAVLLPLCASVMALSKVDPRVGYPHNAGLVLYSEPKSKLNYHVLDPDGATNYVGKTRKAKNGKGCDGQENTPIWVLEGAGKELHQPAIVIGTNSTRPFTVVRSKIRDLKTKINQGKQSQSCTITVIDSSSKKTLFSVEQDVSFDHCDLVGRADANGDGSADIFLLNFGDYQGTGLVIEEDGHWRLQKGVDPGPC